MTLDEKTWDRLRMSCESIVMSILGFYHEVIPLDMTLDEKIWDRLCISCESIVMWSGVGIYHEVIPEMTLDVLLRDRLLMSCEGIMMSSLPLCFCNSSKKEECGDCVQHLTSSLLNR